MIDHRLLPQLELECRCREDALCAFTASGIGDENVGGERVEAHRDAALMGSGIRAESAYQLDVHIGEFLEPAIDVVGNAEIVGVIGPRSRSCSMVMTGAARLRLIRSQGLFVIGREVDACGQARIVLA